jgi:hypothetical protein
METDSEDSRRAQEVPGAGRAERARGYCRSPVKPILPGLGVGQRSLAAPDLRASRVVHADM